MAKSTGKIAVARSDTPSAVASPAQASSVHPLASLRRQIDHLFDDFTRPFWPSARSLFDERVWAMPRFELTAPAVDVTENDTEFAISAELPGMDEKDVEVTVSGDVLTIRGEKKQESEKEGKGYHVSERRFGSVQRAFALPAGVDADRISAEFAKGVLRVTLPKTAQARSQPKRIEVRTR